MRTKQKEKKKKHFLITDPKSNKFCFFRRSCVDGTEQNEIDKQMKLRNKMAKNSIKTTQQQIRTTRTI